VIAAGTEALPHVALYVLVGGLLGALGGLFGIGGGVIAIPVLGFFFGAFGTSGGLGSGC